MNVTPVDFPAHAPCDTRDLSVVKYLGVHHSDTPLETTVLQIDRMHRDRGFVMFGYHYAVDTNGVIYQGRQLNEVPAAAQGHNTDSVDIVLIGQFEPSVADYNGPPSSEQWDSLTKLAYRVHQWVPSIQATLGHHDLGLMAVPPYIDQCPGKDVLDRMQMLRDSIGALLYVNASV